MTNNFISVLMEFLCIRQSVWMSLITLVQMAFFSSFLILFEFFDNEIGKVFFDQL